MYTYQVEGLQKWLLWLNKIAECGSLIGLPKSGAYRTIQYVLGQSQFEDSFQLLDLSVLPCHLREFKETATSLFQRYHDSHVSFVVIDQLKLHSKSGRQQLRVLRSLRQLYQNQFQFLFVFSEDIQLVQQTLSRRVYADILFQNLYYFPYANQHEFGQLVDQNSLRFSVKPSSEQLENVYQLSGGCPFLVKNLFKRLSEGKSLALDEESVSWGESILCQLRQELLPDLISGSIDNPVGLSFQKLGLLDSNFQITSQIIAQSLKTYEVTPKIEINSDTKTIKIGRYTNPSQLSPSDNEILFALACEGKLPRSQIAQICYGRSDSYSDYAIDKIISRLRAKLVSLGLKPNIIKTKRAYGYVLNLSNDRPASV